jgi:hypothetical protein
MAMAEESSDGTVDLKPYEDSLASIISGVREELIEWLDSYGYNVSDKLRS